MRSEVKIHIGKVLSSARREKGLTQEEVAEFLNLSRASITNTEAGRHMPVFEDMYKLCCLYDIQPNDLFPPIKKYEIEEVNETYTITKTKKIYKINPHP